ncbi:biotin synthesis protein bioC [Yersinia thracica]|uniref:Biotin synthesis protein bioC n=1 Tax=Yersinia thracica TaxID=2890319 RepID=A0A0T9QCB5_9GAMM|nr:hypothetical protein [Yersinia thracica]CNI05346.1 biotin synthesis protein bioC [Yersinia thracica]
MTQKIYDNQDFFSGYAKLSRSVDGLDGTPEWPAICKILPPLPGQKSWPVNSYQAEGKRVTDVLALDEEKERPMIFLLSTQKPA